MQMHQALTILAILAACGLWIGTGIRTVWVAYSVVIFFGLIEPVTTKDAGAWLLQIISPWLVEKVSAFGFWWWEGAKIITAAVVILIAIGIGWLVSLLARRCTRTV